MREVDIAVGPAERVHGLGWDQLAGELNELGCALTEPVLSPAECAEIAALYADDDLFRATIDMAPRRFGQGEYRYFADPVPAMIGALRAAFWPHLLPVARDWAPSSAGRRRGRTSSPPGSASATRPASGGPRRCCSATGRVTGMRCTRTCTASCTSRCRSWSAWTRREPTTSAERSCWWSSGRGPSRAGR